ncbi:MAG: hypothetical protein ACKOCI_10450 [Cyanobium sp.]
MGAVEPQELHRRAGRQDPVVPYQASEALREQLQAAGAAVELLGFDGGHAIDPGLFPAIRQFLAHCWQGRAEGS